MKSKLQFLENVKRNLDKDDLKHTGGATPRKYSDKIKTLSRDYGKDEDVIRTALLTLGISVVEKMSEDQLIKKFHNIHKELRDEPRGSNSFKYSYGVYKELEKLTKLKNRKYVIEIYNICLSEGIEQFKKLK